MAQWEISYLERARAESANSGTLYIDLPKSEQISMIMLEFSCYNTAATSRLYSRTILDVVKSIRVLLEGSKDAYNVQPEVASYLAWLQAGVMPAHRIRERGQTMIRVPIIFGRYPRDEEYLLDTAAYSSAQLQVEYELNTTYETTATTEYTVWLLRPTKRVSPQGFIRSRIVQEYTSAVAGETRQVDLPTGLPWLRTGFRVFDIDAFNNRIVTDVDLNIDQGRQHIFDGRFKDLETLNKLWNGSQVVGPEHWVMTLSGDYVQNIMADPDRLLWSDYGAAVSIYNSSAIWSNQHQLTMRDDAGTAITVALDTAVTAIGGFPFSCYTIGEFGLEPFPAPQHNEAFIEYVTGAYAALIQTWVQEVVRGAL